MARFARRRRYGFRLRKRRSFRRPPRRMFKRVKRVERAVKTLSSTIETKCLDIYSPASSDTVDYDWGVSTTGFNGTIPGTPASMLGIPLNNLSTGTTNGTRIGLEVKFTSLNFNYWLGYATSALVNDRTNFVRIMIVLEKLPAVSLGVISPLSLTDVLDTPAVSNSNQVNWPYNWGSRKRFRVLFDRVHALTDIAGNLAVVNVKTRIKLGYKTEYQGTSADSIRKNRLWIFCLSDSAFAPFPRFGYAIRLKYRDA